MTGSTAGTSVQGNRTSITNISCFTVLSPGRADSTFSGGIVFLNFIYFWLHWVFIAAHGLSLVAASRGSSLLRARASHYSGFFCFGARALAVRASVVVAWGLSSCGSQDLERRLNSCGPRA